MSTRMPRGRSVSGPLVSPFTATTTSLLSPSSQPLTTVDLFSTLSVCHSKSGVYMAPCVCDLWRLASFHSAQDSPCVTELQLVPLSGWEVSRGVGGPQLVQPLSAGGHLD